MQVGNTLSRSSWHAGRLCASEPTITQHRTKDKGANLRRPSNVTPPHRKSVFFRRGHACLVCTPSRPKQEGCKQRLSLRKFSVQRELQGRLRAVLATFTQPRGCSEHGMREPLYKALGSKCQIKRCRIKRYQMKRCQIKRCPSENWAKPEQYTGQTGKGGRPRERVHH